MDNDERDMRRLKAAGEMLSTDEPDWEAAAVLAKMTVFADADSWRAFNGKLGKAVAMSKSRRLTEEEKILALEAARLAPKGVLGETFWTGGILAALCVDKGWELMGELEHVSPGCSGWLRDDVCRIMADGGKSKRVALPRARAEVLDRLVTGGFAKAKTLAEGLVSAGNAGAVRDFSRRHGVDAGGLMVGGSPVFAVLARTPGVNKADLWSWMLTEPGPLSPDGGEGEVAGTVIGFAPPDMAKKILSKLPAGTKASAWELAFAAEMAAGFDGDLRSLGLWLEEKTAMADWDEGVRRKSADVGRGGETGVHEMLLSAVKRFHERREKDVGKMLTPDDVSALSVALERLPFTTVKTRAGKGVFVPALSMLRAKVADAPGVARLCMALERAGADPVGDPAYGKKEGFLAHLEKAGGEKADVGRIYASLRDADALEMATRKADAGNARKPRI